MTPFLFFVWFQLGREVPAWKYDKLFERADLVVIAIAESTEAAGAQIKERPPAGYLEPVLTTLEVRHVLKGEHRDKKLVVLHYQYKATAEMRKNGPALAEFHERSPPLAPPEYMVFLKRRQDGRFECVTGQYDPSFSVRQLIRP